MFFLGYPHSLHTQAENESKELEQWGLALAGQRENPSTQGLWQQPKGTCTLQGHGATQLPARGEDLGLKLWCYLQSWFSLQKPRTVKILGCFLKKGGEKRNPKQNWSGLAHKKSCTTFWARQGLKSIPGSAQLQVPVSPYVPVFPES